MEAMLLSHPWMLTMAVKTMAMVQDLSADSILEADSKVERVFSICLRVLNSSSEKRLKVKSNHY